MPEPTSASVAIEAPPQVVWDLVSDITRMPSWSPELSSAKWVSGAREPVVGARFRGTNRNGARRWRTSCEVVAAESPSLFRYRVSSLGLPVAEWCYAITPTASGCELSESTTDRRGVLIKLVSRPITGVTDRTARNLEGIRSTIAAIKAAAEHSAIEQAG